ncbi:MAG: hypothetical protein JWP58_3677 [Hymenobacter sp.]|nr:hypothetical protein [Hymenobacter sp.]
MKQLLILVLGLVLTTSLAAQAQATQVWQREYGEKPFTYVDFLQPQFLRPNRLAAIVTTSQRISNNYYFGRSGPIFFNSQGDTLSSRRYTFDIGAYYAMLPLPGGDLLLTGAEDSAYVPNTSNLSYFYVRTDSLGNRRTPLHYLPPYRTAGYPTPLLPMPRGGTL